MYRGSDGSLSDSGSSESSESYSIDFESKLDVLESEARGDRAAQQILAMIRKALVEKQLTPQEIAPLLSCWDASISKTIPLETYPDEVRVRLELTGSRRKNTSKFNSAGLTSSNAKESVIHKYAEGLSLAIKRSNKQAQTYAKFLYLV